MYFLQNFNRSKTRFHQYLLCCFISFFLVFFHFLKTMHKKSALIFITDTYPYKKIIKIISTFFVIFFSYYQDFFCARVSTVKPRCSYGPEHRTQAHIMADRARAF